MGLRQRKEKENLRGQRGARRAPLRARGPRSSKCAPAALQYPGRRGKRGKGRRGAEQRAQGAARRAAARGLSWGLGPQQGPTTRHSPGSSEAPWRQRLGLGLGVLALRAVAVDGVLPDSVEQVGRTRCCFCWSAPAHLSFSGPGLPLGACWNLTFLWAPSSPGYLFLPLA